MPIPAASPRPTTLARAYEAAYRTDPVSAFGGIIAFNRELDAATARSIVGRQFAEVIAAPAVAAEARAVLAQKPDIRVLEVARAASVRRLPPTRTRSNCAASPAACWSRRPMRRTSAPRA